METITLKINNKTKAGRAIKDLIEVLGIEVVKENSSYDPKFVAKVKAATKRANFKEVNPKDVWGSLGLK